MRRVRSWAAAAVAVALSLGPASAAYAEPGSLGWLRVTPAAGTLDDPIDVLAQGACPEGESIVVTVSGPGIPRQGNVGNIVGNTSIAALPPTESGQLYAPLQVPLRLWFAQNAPGLTPKGRYTLTMVCRDRIRSSLVHGTFSGSLDIAAGSYRAVGDAAKAFNTTKVSVTDPLLTEEPGPPPSPEPSPTTAPSQPGETSEPSDPATAGSDAPAPSTSPQPSATTAAGQEVAAPATVPASQQRQQGGSARWVIIALAVAAAAAGLLIAARKSPSAPKGGASTGSLE